jgi:hypothetical protein
VIVVLLAWMAWRAERSAPALPPMWKWGLAAAVLMGLWWYGLLGALLGWQRIKSLLHTEVSDRVAGAMHREGMHYYLLLLPAVIFPWSLGLPAALAAAWPRADRQRSGSDELADSFLVAWILGVIFFFSIPGAKLATYILPALPAVALLIARLFMTLSRSPDSVGRPWLRITQAMALALGLALLIFPAVLSALPEAAAVFVHELLGSEKNARLWILAGAAALIFPGSWLLAVRGREGFAPLLLGAGAFALILAAARPSVDFLNPRRSTKFVCADVQDKLRDCTRIVALGVHSESLSFYLNRHIEELESKQIAREREAAFLGKILGDKEPSALFIDKRHFPRIFGRAEAKSLTPDAIAKRLPSNLTYIFSNQNLLVVRNQPAKQ